MTSESISKSESPAEASQTTGSTDWRTISVKPRVDSFNQRELLDQLQQLDQMQKTGDERHLWIALDLKGNRFLSFPVIKACVKLAQEVTEKGGRFALLACSEKTRRHFEIYGSLDHVLLLMGQNELPPPVFHPAFVKALEAKAAIAEKNDLMGKSPKAAIPAPRKPESDKSEPEPSL